MEVRAYYDGFNEDADKMIYSAAGRISDFSGGGINGRDHGWVCETELEARRIEKNLRKFVAWLKVEIRDQPKEGDDE